MNNSWITDEIEEEYGRKKENEGGKKFLIPIVVVLIILVIAATAVIYLRVNSDDISAYADAKIKVTGLTEEPFYVTPAELLELKCVEVYANGGTNKSAGVNGYGPELTTFLEHYGRELGEFKKVKFVCADNYTVVLKREYITDDYQIVLSVKQLTQKLPRSQQPLRLIIPDTDSGKWAYGIEEIEFTEK